MHYDLYVDESGTFSENTNCLVGGFWLKRENENTETLPPDKAEEWIRAVQQAGCTAGKWTADDLIKGEIFSLNKENPNGNHVSHRRPNRTPVVVPGRDNWYSGKCAGGFIFSHCCENSLPHGNRWERQAYALSKFKEIIGQNEGKIAIFRYDGTMPWVDNTTCYITVLTKGIICLFEQLLRQDTEMPYIHLHIAQRSRIGSDGNPVGVIEANDYKNSLKTYFQFAMDRERIAMPEIQSIYQNLEVIVDIQETGANVPQEILDGLAAMLLNDPSAGFAVSEPIRQNETITFPDPRTVICDYCCNSYLSRNSFGRDGETVRSVYADQFICDVFDTVNMDSDDVQSLMNAGAYSSVLLRLICSGLPSPATDNFFVRFNRAKDAQLTCMEAVIGFFKEKARAVYADRTMMTDIDAWVDAFVEAASDHMADRKALAVLEANLILIQHAMRTHRGDWIKVQESENAFIGENGVIYRCRDRNERDKLLLLYYNRVLVDCNDRFDYERGLRIFNALRAYWENIQNNDYMFNLVAQDTEAERIQEHVIEQDRFTSDEYGKEIGSYLQLAAHYIRAHSGNDTEKHNAILYFNIDQRENLYAAAERNMDSEMDIVRHYQNVCNLENALGNRDVAVSSLCRASQPNLAPRQIEQMGETEKCRVALSGAIDALGNLANPFILLRYIQTMADAFAAGEQEFGNAMFETLGNNGWTAVDLIRSNNIKAECTWHYAFAWIMKTARPEHPVNSNSEQVRRFINAINLFEREKQPLFYAIAVGARAQLLKLMTDGIIHVNNGYDAYRAMLEETYSEFTAAINGSSFKNPFTEPVMNNLNHTIRQIGY